MMTDNDSIIEFFKSRDGHGRGQFLHNAAYYLMRMILAQRDFKNVECLTAFCEDPENLRPWLPSQTDRLIFSQGLQDGLREWTTANVRPGGTARPSLTPHGATASKSHG